MIVSKFKYEPMSRVTVNGHRLYATPDGKKLPSVTTILDATKPQEKRVALEAWRRRVGHERAQQITTEAANRGTRMHSYLEHYVNPEHLVYLSGMIIDYQRRGLNEGFEFINANEKDRCGCGESFRV